ncbi:MAG: hypothetical protein KDD09_12385, partial [Phaeodactylibacter sp.]|nr:hypothetical protein [Phaeodactylibacter sp.]
MEVQYCNGECTGTYATDIVLIDPTAPVATVTDVGNICSGETQDFSTLNQGAGTTYTWDFGPYATPSTATGRVQNGIEFNLPASQLGNLNTTVTVTVVRNGCTATDSEIFTILDIPEATISSTNPTCGDANGTITFTYPDNPSRTGIVFSIDGGTTYPYGTGDNTGSFTVSNLAAGNYDLWARWGDNACPVDLLDAVLVSENGPTVDAGPDQSICEGGTATLSATATGGTGAIAYTWMPGNLSGASVGVSPTAITTYTVTATDANNCTSTDQVVVTVVADPQVSITINTSDICVGATATLTAATSGGLNCAAVQWQSRAGTSGAWSNVGTGNTYATDAALAAGTYQYRALYNCSGTGCDNGVSNIITFTVKPEPAASFPNPGTQCEGVAVSFTAADAGAGATYDWDFGAGASPATATGIGPHSVVYANPDAATQISPTATLTVSLDGCTAQAVQTFNVRPEPEVTITPSNPATCGGSDGSLSFVVVRSGNFQISIDGGNTWQACNQDVVSGLSAGAYNIAVRYCNGDCVYNVTTITLSDPASPTATITGGNNLCSGDAQSFTAADQGVGTTYTWDFGPYASPVTATGLNPGPVTFTLPAAQLGNLATTVTLTVERNGCVDAGQATFTILDTPEGALSATPATCGADNGTVTIAIPDNPDRTGIAFSIDGGATYPLGGADNAGSYTFTGLAAGTYEVLSRWGDGNCEVSLGSVVVSQENGPTVGAGPDQSICEGGTATLSATATDGTGAIAYTWMPGNLSGASVNVSPTATTTYSVTATDANNCTSTDQVTVTVVPDPEVTITATGSDVCEGGSITLTATPSGGLNCQAVQWQIRPGTSGTWANIPGGTGNTYTTDNTLTAGTYQYRASLVCAGTDCQNDVSNVVTLTVVPDPLVTITIDDNEVCEGETGTLTATPSGGLNCNAVQWQFRPGTSGAWTNISGATGNTYTTDNALTAGTYQYRASLVCTGVNCNNDVSNIITFTVNGLPLLDAGPNLDKCPENSLPIDANVTSGTAPYTYAWTATGGSFVDASIEDPVYNMMAPGTYTLTLSVTDANGCMATNQLMVTVNPSPSLDAGAAQTICEGESADLSATASGGTAPYTFTWDIPATGANQTVSPTPAAYANESFTYNVTVTDANGCTATDAVTVSVLSTPDVTVSSTNPTCGSANGTITFSFPDHPNRGAIEFSLDGGATYTISSGDNAGSVTATSLTAGVYDLWVRWANDQCPVDLPDESLMDQGGPTVNAGADEEICEGGTVNLTAMATGGTAPIIYNWMPGNLSGASVDVSPTATTTYTVTATDANNCTSTDQVTATVVPDPEVTITASGSDVCEGGSITMAATPTGGLNCQAVQWQFRVGTSGAFTNISGATGNAYTTDNTLIVGTYQYRASLVCTGTDCQNDVSNIVTLTVVPDPEVVVSIDDDVICEENETTTLTATTSGGFNCSAVQWEFRPGTSGTWTNVGSGNTYTTDVNLSAGTYQYRARYNCSGANCNNDISNIVTLTVEASATLGDFVFEDLDADGIQDTGEPGIANVTVNLLDENGIQLSTTTTDVNGLYSFPDLCAGNYIVEFINPGGGFIATTQLNTNGDDPNDSDADPNTGQTSIIDLVPGQNDPTNDAGYYMLASLGDFVWLDSDHDGVQDTGEPGVANVTVNLLDDMGNIINTTATGNDGSYSFTGLLPGTYSVQFELPAGYAYTPQDQGDDALDSDADPNNNGITAPTILESGENDPTLDAGIFPDCAVTVTASETEICEGETVTITATGTGGLTPYTYTWNTGQSTASFTDTPAAGTQTYTVALTDANGCTSTASVTVIVNDNPEASASATNTTCGDANGSATITVTGGTTPFSYTWSPNVSTTAMANNLSAGTYDFTVTDANGCTDTGSVTVGNDDGPTVNAGTDVTICEGETTTLTATSTGGLALVTYTWMPEALNGASVDISPTTTTTYTVTATDANGCMATDQVVVTVTPLPVTAINGPDQRCAGEGAQFQVNPPLSGATYLWTFGGPATPSSSTQSSVVVTWADVPGQYTGTLEVTQNGCTNIYTQDIVITEEVKAIAGPDQEICQGASTNLDANGSSVFGNYLWTVQSGDFGSIDFGANTISPTVSPQLTTVYELRVTDPVNNCFRVDFVTVTVDVDLNPIADATVNDSEVCVGTQVTLDASGSQAPPLDPGALLAYQWYEGNTLFSTAFAPAVTVNTTTTYELIVISQNTGCTDTAFVTVDVINCGALGDFVWQDTDGDGIQDAGEPGILGVTVNLLDENMNFLQSTTTAADGSYLFTDLQPGNYFVEFVTPSGFEPTTPNQGGDDAMDSDADPLTGKTSLIVLSSGETDLTNDAGYYEPASLGDFVWSDTDADGTQDAGEPGISDVTVNLYADTNQDGIPDGAAIGTTTTDGTGFYEFTGLAPGDYVVEFVGPAGFAPSLQDQGGDDTIDSDADATTGLSATVNLESGENDPTIDAGYYESAFIGDYVWQDTDGDGIQDAGEPAIAGVTVNLYEDNNQDGVPDGAPIATDVTDANGEYGFPVNPGSYVVEFVTPGGFTGTPQDQGGDDTTDSDADPNTGLTGTITINSGETDLTNDAGYYEAASLGDYVWLDTNANGLQDDGATGIANVTVNLYADTNQDGTPDGAAIGTTTTDGTGFYEFTGLAPG